MLLKDLSALIQPANSDGANTAADASVKLLLQKAARTGFTEENSLILRKALPPFQGCLRLVSVPGEHGLVLSYAAHLRDVSVLEKAHQRSWLLSLLVSTVKDYAIFMLDPTGHVLTWNAGAQRLKYYTEEEIVGKHFSTFYTQPDIDSGKPEMELRTATAVGSYEDEGWRLRKDGSTFWANVIITAVFHPVTHALLGFAKVTRDLTERRRAEEHLVTSFRDSAQRKAEFIASTSHEIRTPLNGVIGMAELLASTSLDDTQRSYVRWIEKSGTDLIQLINDILDVSKIEAGKMELDEQPFLLRTLLADMQDYALAAITQKSELQFRPLFDHIEADLMVVGDRGRLRQVLTNLLSNATKFTKTGFVCLRADILEKDANHLLVRFNVSDTGIGISEEDQARLFVPYAQVRAAQNSGLHGTGLGLAIAKRLVQLMRGELKIESAPGEGTIFFFDIPLQVPMTPILDEDRAMHPLAGHALIADDNEVNRLIMSRLIGLIGCTSTVVESGADAIAALKKESFDVILMDVEMPDKNGHETTIEIRKFDSKTPIVACTANALPEEAAKCRSVGMNGVLTKPITRKRMFLELSKYLLKGTGSPISVPSTTVASSALPSASHP